MRRAETAQAVTETIRDIIGVLNLGRGRHKMRMRLVLTPEHFNMTYLGEVMG